MLLSTPRWAPQAMSHMGCIFFEMQHSGWDMVPQQSAPSAESAMCPADYIPVCITLYDVCFFHNSGALLTHIEFAWHYSHTFHSTQLLSQIVATWAVDCSCLALKFCFCPYRPTSYFTFSSHFPSLSKIILNYDSVLQTVHGLSHAVKYGVAFLGLLFSLFV